MGWLGVSLVLSVVLTLALNVALRLFPGSGDRLAHRVEQLAEGDPGGRRTRVFVPWKAMLIGSILLTVVLNLVFWIR